MSDLNIYMYTDKSIDYYNDIQKLRQELINRMYAIRLDWSSQQNVTKHLKRCIKLSYRINEPLLTKELKSILKYCYKDWGYFDGRWLRDLGNGLSYPELSAKWGLEYDDTYHDDWGGDMLKKQYGFVKN